MTRTMARASIALGTWASATAPANAATAGSRLRRIPNVAAVSWRSAASSSAKGSTDPRTATASPTSRTRASRSALPAGREPERREHDRGHEERQGEPRAHGPVLEHSLGQQDVGRPAGRGPEGEGEPDRIELDTRAPQQGHPGAGQRDPEEVACATRPDHGDRERAQELDGRRQAERNAVDRLVEARVHECDCGACGDHPAQRPWARGTKSPRVQREQQERSEADAEPDERERPNPVERHGRQGCAELDGERRAHHEQRRRCISNAG